MTAPVNRETFCRYEEGMFAKEELSIGDEMEALRHVLITEEAVCCHEAAHGVFNYVLGFGASATWLFAIVGETDDGERTLRHGGGTMRSDTLSPARFRDGYTLRILAEGASKAAGPAAERKYYIENAAPIRVLDGSHGDHAALDTIVKGLWRFGGRNGYAYRRLVWRVVQAGLEIPAIWDAVTRVADELRNYYPNVCPEDDIGEYRETLSADDFRKIIRRTGARVGMLGFTYSRHTRN